MFDWLFDLIDDLFDGSDDEPEAYVPEPTQPRLSNPQFSPKLRLRLDQQRPTHFAGQPGRRLPPPQLPTARPTVPPIWHDSYPGNWFKKINQQNNWNNPHSLQNRNHPLNPQNPHSLLNRNHPLNPHNPINMHRPSSPMKPFGPTHRR